MKRIAVVLLLALLLALGGYLAYRSLTTRAATVEESSILLEKMEKVLKLVTVEGHFTEIFSRNEYQGDWGVFWDKKVMLRVQAKVSVGYDLKKVSLIPDPDTRTMTLSAWPEPEILSIEHRLDYYDISTGLFQSMTPADYNRINQAALDSIRVKAAKSKLIDEARTQRDEALDLLRFMAQNAGWKLEEAASAQPSTQK